MPSSAAPSAAISSRTLTYAANIAFLPTGIATVLLGPMLPTLSARWSLNYAQAGSLFTVQFFASTVAVFFSGALASRWGFRLAIAAGLLLQGAGVAGLPLSSRWLGLACIAAYGSGIGLTVPAANLLVAEVNPTRRSAALNLVNFFWSVGAVACPFLIAAAGKVHKLPLFLGGVGGFMLLVVLGIAATISRTAEPVVSSDEHANSSAQIPWGERSLLVLSALFFLYVGTENAVGGWVASYAKSLAGAKAALPVMVPSFFYSALMLGRWLAPPLLRRVDEVRLARAGIVLACAGMAGLIFSHSVRGVVVSVSLTGLGLAAVYPITISLLAREFGPRASHIGSLTFTLANFGGASLPWLVGYISDRLGRLNAGLAVPLLAGMAMYVLYWAKWKNEAG
jgi:fucose permease